jgi:RNA polymerase sigma-70 factor (ECF subfamily)
LITLPAQNDSIEEDRAVELVKDGKLEGLEILVRRYYFQAVHVSYLIVQEPAQAEDIVQDAFMRACEKINQLSSARFSPWFLRIVVNASIKAARKQKRQLSLDAQEQDEAQTLLDRLVDQNPSPVEITEFEDLRQSIRMALSKLNPDQRAVVVMKYILEMSEKEIVHELNSPLSTIKGRLYSARMKLRALLRAGKNVASPTDSKTTSSCSED